MAFDQRKYVNEYMKENYDRIDLRIPKGGKDKLKTIAINNDVTDDKGKISITKVIVDALEGFYKIDLSKPE